MQTIVALLTDFGSKDNYVGILKGVLLDINKKIQCIDICHDVYPYNIVSASFLLYSSFDYFPKDTIFLIVVDPGVGSARNEIVGIIDGKYVVCPDNGIITLLYKMKNSGDFYKIDRNKIIKTTKREINPTFHGRDIFAPACGIISKNGFKKIITDKINPLKIDTFNNKILKNKIIGKIIHIDIYGNCITSIYKNDIKKFKSINKIKINKTTIFGINKYFSEVPPGKILAYWGSSGFLEIAIREDNVCKKLNIKQLDSVELFL
jgi:hypothetical protein